MVAIDKKEKKTLSPILVGMVEKVGKKYKFLFSSLDTSCDRCGPGLKLFCCC